MVIGVLAFLAEAEQQHLSFAVIEALPERIAQSVNIGSGH
jgi:hypothetical protein